MRQMARLSDYDQDGKAETNNDDMACISGPEVHGVKITVIGITEAP